jgi:hypothetical protein
MMAQIIALLALLALSIDVRVRQSYRIQNYVTPQAAYAAASANCAAMSIRSTGTKYYICDCEAGAQAGCVAGNDATGNGTAATPWKTFAKARDTFNNTMQAGDTLAMCKGGSWTTDTNTSANRWHNPRCTAPADPRVAANTNTCDIRDYTASWGGTNKPLISASSAATLFSFDQYGASSNGVRILNLELNGKGGGPYGAAFGDCGVWMYGPHNDHFYCNNTMTSWNLAFNIQNRDSGDPSRIHVVGNKILNSTADAYLYGASGGSIDANFMDNNGASNNRDHTIYLANDFYAGGGGIIGFSITNNEIRYSSSSCSGVVIVAHGQVTNLLVDNNIVDGGSTSVDECYGISITSGGYGTAEWFKNSIVRRNVLTRTGRFGIDMSNSPDYLIENNTIYLTGASSDGISAPSGVTSVAGSSATTRGTIRNNTIYTNSGSGCSFGIQVSGEGTGYVIANNSIMFADTACACFDTGLAAGAYTFVGNNACYRGTSWGTTYDATTHITTNPLYTNAPTDFKPQAGSPLNGAGSNTYKAATDINLKTRPNPPAIGALER